MSFFDGIVFNENFLFQVFISGKQKTFGFCVQVYDKILVFIFSLNRSNWEVWTLVRDVVKSIANRT